MARYIDAYKLLEENKNAGFYSLIPEVRKAVDTLIKKQPIADVKEVVRGEWIEIKDYNKCSNCGHEITFFGNCKAKFCLECGADMREK